MSFLPSKKARIMFVVVGIVVFSSIMYAKRDTKLAYESFKVERGDVVSKVGVSGSVQPLDDYKLSFEQQGRVGRIFAKVNDIVKKGQLLATLQNADIGADIAGAMARLDAERTRLSQHDVEIASAESRLSELRSGSRPEEILIKKTQLETRETEYDKTIRDTLYVMRDAQLDSAYVVESTLGGFFRGQQSSSYHLSYQTCDVQHTTNVEWERFLRGEDIKEWEKKNSELKVTNSFDAQSGLLYGLNKIAMLEMLVSDISQTLFDDCTRTNSSLDMFRTSLDSARARIASIRSAMRIHQQLLIQKQNAYQQARSEYELVLEGPRKEVIEQQESAVASAKIAREQQRAYVKQQEAGVALMRARAIHTIIVSPIAGKIVQSDVRVGEIASPGKIVFRIQSDGVYEIETFIPEVDIADVHTLDSALVTLDAYGRSVEFAASVISIESAETMKEGVPTYKTILHFDDADERIKSGMTANVDIVTARAVHVLKIPLRAISFQQTFPVVKVMNNVGEIVEKNVLVGLKGTDGLVEIYEGVIQEGDILVIPKL